MPPARGSCPQRLLNRTYFAASARPARITQASFERFDPRIEIHFDRFVVVEDGRNLAIDFEDFVDRHLGDPNRVFDRKDNVLGDFNELTDEGQILRRFWNRRRSVALCPRHKHTGDVGQSAWNAGRSGKRLAIEIEVTAKLVKNFGATTI